MSLEDRVLSARLLPDPLLRRIIRSRVTRLQSSFDHRSPRDRAEREQALLTALESGPITVHADAANRQHYELPPEFFARILGPRLKYSCCYWAARINNAGGGATDLARPGDTAGESAGGLAEAEEAMLQLTAERAGLVDGQDILDLGCGWGSLSLWAAERYPGSRILAMSNSSAQRRFIERVRDERGLTNLEVVTAEVGEFRPERGFDRVVSVEMMEHVRNHRVLLDRVVTWLRPGGRLFVHIFCHRRHLYTFDADVEGAWMAQHFFSGGLMPSWDYLIRYQSPDLSLLDRWEVGGEHYALTLRAWLHRLDQQRDHVMPLLEKVYGRDQASLWWAHWRIFFMACEETFALDRGRSYFVGHYLFSKPS